MKRLYSFLPTLLLISHGCNCGLEEELESICPQPTECYLPYGEDNTEQNIITGEKILLYKERVCSFGKTVCVQETQEVFCEGMQYAREEICDGIDNDCNGLIDDGEHLIVDEWKSNNPCRETEKGVCRFSEARCSMGEWHCIPPQDLYGDEVCDNQDNDCDGEIDEDIEENFIYTGPEETLNVGECRAGVEKCIGGQIVNFGMVTPVLEICGNGDDDDCDGLVDERERGHDEYDFALIIDVSGSMASYLLSVKQALCDWETDSRFQNSKFAIVAVGTNDLPYGATLITDFVNAGDACSFIHNYFASGVSSATAEYQLDAIIHAMTIGDEIELSWSATRKKKIVLFSDEEPQFLMPSNPGVNGSYPTTESKIDEITEACVTTETTISVFGVFTALWNTYWLEMTSNCNGYLEYLAQDSALMLDRLNYWFGDEC